jgi:hypothetical protein
MNFSFDGRPVRFQLESNHVVLIDPLVLSIRTFDDLKEAIIDQLRARYPSQAPSLPFSLSLPTGKTLTLTLEPGDERSVGVATLTLTGDPPERLRVTRSDTDRSKLQINGDDSSVMIAAIYARKVQDQV